MEKQPMSNRKPTALITGASSGIGADLARRFAQEGHDLVLTARREARLQELAGELKAAFGTRTTVIAMDIGQPGAAQALFDAVRAKNIAIDVLVNNAGLLTRGPFTDVALQDQMNLLQVNVVAPTALAHLFLQPMLARNSGRILNVCSLSGFQPTPRIATYAAGKAYLMSLSEALWSETRNTGVTVTALCPGFTKTDMIANDDHSTMHIPFIPVMSSTTVAKQAYDACMAGKPLYVNGLANSAVAELNRMQPRPMQRWLVNQIGKYGL
jgi:short-subunit dehydrogenase